jgi:hypothetical protein
MDKPLKKWIVHTYGSQRILAEDLGVTTMTIQNWVNKNPEGLLKHVPSLRLKSPDEMMTLVEAIVNQQREILKEMRK